MYIFPQEDADALYLVTERIVPLASLLKDMSELDIALGIYTIASSLSFLHKNALMCHNNIRLQSIFVSNSDNLWRLGGSENICKYSDVKESMVGEVIRAASPECPSAPEDIDGTFSSNDIHCRDSWMLGHLILKLADRFNGKADGQLVKFKQTIKQFYCSADPRKRPSIETFLSVPYFNALPQLALINSVEFLESITIKSDEEKRQFFRKASNDLFHVTSDCFQKYLMRLMFSDLIFADENAREYLLPRLLSVKTKRESNGFYKAESYAKIMAPLLKELYKRRAKHTRLVLLRLSRWYVPFLPSHFVKDSILPEVLLGLNDTDDAIVMATFNALAVFTSFLGATTVVGSAMQKANFHDSFPRGTEEKAPVPSASSDPGITNETFKNTLNGRVMNDSDLDSGKEYPMYHASNQDLIKAEREKRQEEFKKRREARKKRESQQKAVKLIEVASQPGPSNHTNKEGVSDITNHSILKKERYTHAHTAGNPALLIHEQQGYSMEYKGSMSDNPAWGSDDNLDLGSEDEEEPQSLLDIVKRTSESGPDIDDNEPEIDVSESIATPVNLGSVVNSNSDDDPFNEEAPVIDTIPIEIKEGEAGFSRWENGGWSDFENQFESDDGIEMKDLKTSLLEIEQPDLILEAGAEHSSVSDIMNLGRAVQPEPEPDFFADMEPTYTAPKLL